MIPSGPAPVGIRSVTFPVAASMRSTSSPSNEVTQAAPSVTATRSGTPGTSTVRSGWRAPDGIRETVSSSALTTHTAPSPAATPTGPGSTSTYAASIGVAVGRATRRRCSRRAPVP